MMDDFEQPIDRIIREAREKGAFDSLPGKGKPLKWEDDSLVPEDQRLAQRLLKDNGFTLDWIEMGRALDEEYAALQAEAQSARAARAAGRLDGLGWRAAARALGEKFRQLNLRVTGYNLRVPHAQLQRRPYPIDPDIKETLD